MPIQGTSRFAWRSTDGWAPRLVKEDHHGAAVVVLYVMPTVWSTLGRAAEERCRGQATMRRGATALSRFGAISTSYSKARNTAKEAKLKPIAA
jgi:hypothetical protein